MNQLIWEVVKQTPTRQPVVRAHAYSNKTLLGIILGVLECGICKFHAQLFHEFRIVRHDPMGQDQYGIRPEDHDEIHV